MAQILVTAEKTVNAPADTVFGYVRDMREHPNFLPPAFSDFQVESGGVGPGTITRFTVTARALRRGLRRPSAGCRAACRATKWLPVGGNSGGGSGGSPFRPAGTAGSACTCRWS